MMPNSHAELSSEEKLILLKSLIAGEDASSDNQPIYQEYLSDADPEVRALAVKGLWEYPDPALVDLLMEMANHDPAPPVRYQAIRNLGRYVYEGEMTAYDFGLGPDELPEEDYRRVVAFLLDIARDPSVTLDAQRFAVEALGFSSEPEIVDLIEEAYHSPHVDMKVSALFAMGRSGMTRWDSYVMAELDAPDPRIQLEAVRAAGELHLDAATPSLLDLGFDDATDDSLRQEAIWALGHTTSPEAWQLLDDIASNPMEDEETRQIAEAALAEYHMFQEIAEAEHEYEEEYEDYRDDDFAEAEDEGGNGHLPGW